MENNILTIEEYTEKVNNLVKPMVNFAMNTKEFRANGCYCQEFVKVGDKEVTFAVLDSNWLIVTKNLWDEINEFRTKYYKVKKEAEELMDALKERKKFLGIF